ncbi:MAG: response regulator [Chloroflexi bacterium]|nr:response regulator [Chloroflexota bacterium]
MENTLPWPDVTSRASGHMDHRSHQEILKAGAMEKVILVVDDEVSMTHMLNLILRKKGFKVLTTTDPHQVDSILNSIVPDLIILDYMMPGINGIRLCKMIRERLDTRHTPIFMLSALNDLEVIRDSRAAGADEYFTKDELATRMMREIVRRIDVPAAM